MSIKAAREKKGYSQKQLADLMGVSQPTVCDWETGRKSPASKNLKKLSELLECSADFLIMPNAPRRPIPDEEVKFALFGSTDIDDSVYQEVKRFAEYARSQQEKRNKQPD